MAKVLPGAAGRGAGGNGGSGIRERVGVVVCPYVTAQVRVRAYVCVHTCVCVRPCAWECVCLCPRVYRGVPRGGVPVCAGGPGPAVPSHTHPCVERALRGVPGRAYSSPGTCPVSPPGLARRCPRSGPAAPAGADPPHLGAVPRCSRGPASLRPGEDGGGLGNPQQTRYTRLPPGCVETPPGVGAGTSLSFPRRTVRAEQPSLAGPAAGYSMFLRALSPP